MVGFVFLLGVFPSLGLRHPPTQILPYPPTLHTLGWPTALPDFRKCTLDPTQIFLRAPTHEMTAKFVVLCCLSGAYNGFQALGVSEGEPTGPGPTAEYCAHRSPAPLIAVGSPRASGKGALPGRAPPAGSEPPREGVFGVRGSPARGTPRRVLGLSAAPAPRPCCCPKRPS